MFSQCITGHLVIADERPRKPKDPFFERKKKKQHIAVDEKIEWSH